jgi:hypothetical protein
MNPFQSHPNDILWKFEIKEWFDAADPVACDILLLLVADEDLMNIERFKEILDSNTSGEQSDEITKTKWRKAHFFLLRLQLGFLHNVFKEIINNTYKTKKGMKRRPSLDKLVNGMGAKVKTAYEDLQNTIKNSKNAMRAIDSFRNQASFHYSDGSLRKALERKGFKIGEIIINATENDLHSIVAYQVLEGIPGLDLPEEKILIIKEEVEWLQGKLHAFTFTLFDEYWSTHSLKDKTIS